MHTISIILATAALAWNAYSWWLDFDESGRKLYYGKSEGNKLFRGKDGQMVAWKPIVAFFAVEVGGAIAAYFIANALRGASQGPETGFLASACWNAAMGTWHFFTAKKNISRSRENRAKQILYRDKLKAHIAKGGTVEQWVGSETVGPGVGFGGTIESSAGNSYHPMFRWLTVPQRIGNTDEVQQTRIALGSKHFEWAGLPETDQKAIWHDLKFDPR